MTLATWLFDGVRRTLDAVIDELAPLAAAGLVGLVATWSLEVGVIAVIAVGLAALCPCVRNRELLLRGLT
ncbi:hypothetical protein OM076_01055 [Solirubrobacter ginsenosidimutans]|uniref:Uncharacterized protein n=1 Tax=Solirubrobacter ginsenosidimutans TaxID=490573 RepID=A0A9X3S018_9ACTN|nr:hypothetical protein [Solirubrobacter ginsenosidimutans]MDA0158836.1 hypothetical protein [Solirubrobacter ginsenosidimutans]